jgi:potassium-dependent mechanosensitive channel
VRTCVSLTILVGFWFIWYDEVPTFGGLDAAVWSSPVQVTRTISDADGNETLQSTTELRSVTVSDLVFAVIVLIVTLNFAKNVPALMEVLVLQYLPMDAGGRYAASTLTRYLLTMVGIVVVFGLLGIGWSKLSWLLGALALGLGFGLQEVVANFICGLILLFERPIRVGDIVTVGETTGIATRIQIRATTIRDWDRKEFVVPNKELVTGRLLNWTLSDSTNRLVINVGVAYGSDTEKARALLFDILRADSEVMEDPGPQVTFEGFGDSTLNMVVRAYLPSLENRLETIHRLHTTINRRFAAAGIEIAFPQRDIHVRSLNLPEELVRAGRPGASSNGNGNGHGPHTPKETAGSTSNHN